MFNINNYIEELADKEHASWSRWQKYLHSKCYNVDIYRNSYDNNSNFLGIPREYVNHLEEMITTDYKDLPEKHKEYDRVEVREIEEILKKIYQDGYNDAIDLVKYDY